MTQISIIGCGWLGLPLAKTLLENKFLVKGSTTSIEKLSVLENAGIKPYLIVLTPNSFIQSTVNSRDRATEEKTGNLTAFLENSKILIINIPPKLRSPEKENFVLKIKNIIPFIEKSTIEMVLFISSTSVYGENNLMVTEETALNPDTESGKQLVETEQLLQSNKNFKTTILRFGGLIGEDRHPVRFLSGKTHIEKPNAPINLIHQDDCIGIIIKIIRTLEVLDQKDNSKQHEVFNAVTPFHPSRKDYYTQKAIELNLTLPKFNLEKSTFGKTILSSKIETFLGYTFKKSKL